MSMFSKYENINIRNKDVYLLWLKLGSLERVSKHLESQGKVNQKSGQRYGSVTLSRYAWRYVLLEPEEAYKLTIESGNNIPPEYWEQLIVRKAYTQFVALNHNRQTFYKWLEKHDLEKYKDYKSQKEFFREDSNIQDFQKPLFDKSSAFGGSNT